MLLEPVAGRPEQFRARLQQCELISSQRIGGAPWCGVRITKRRLLKNRQLPPHLQQGGMGGGGRQAADGPHDVRHDRVLLAEL